MNMVDKIEKIITFIREIFPGRDFIPLHEPCFFGNEKKYLMDCVDSTFVSSVGRYVDRFEEMICELTGAKYAIAVVNGTCALHVALQLAGVGLDDEIITQSVSFVATANAITYCGAHPVFLDVEKETLGLDPVALKKFLEKNTQMKNRSRYNLVTGKRIAACVPVHIFGHPCQIDGLSEICQKHNIPLIEDAAESIGSTYKGKYTGTFGLLGVYSFNGNKIVTCGGGGAIVTDNEALARKAKHLTTTAKLPHAYEYIHDMVGYNFRMPNLNAALACAQLEQLNSFIENKRELAQRYKEFFENLKIHFLDEPEHARSNCWLNTILLTDREERDGFLKTTNGRGVMTRPLWQLLNTLEMYKKCQTDKLENARWLEERAVNIPSSVRR